MNWNLLNTVLLLVLLPLGMVAIIAFAYGVARAAGVGFYKSKYEHFKRIWHMTKGDVDDG